VITTSKADIATHQIDVKVYGNNGNENALREVPSSAMTVLDIGCGRGDNARHLKERGMMVDGISISEKEIALAAPYLRAGVLYDVEQGLPGDIKQNKYDVIICSHIIEHIRYPERLLEDVRLIMKPESVFIVALPNIMHYGSRWELMKGNFNYEESGIWDNTHVKWYTFQSARQLLSQNGFDIVKADVTGTIPFLSVLKKIIPGKTQKVIFNVLKGVSKGFFGYELLLVSKIKKIV
jgi:2-polyprenyl-3-methyl-5-hydroxy-6-metoxy-1,4-benzoquinol methylase